jgi:hypothetical protein
MAALRKSPNIGKHPIQGVGLRAHTQPADGLAPVRSGEKTQW